MALPTRRQWLQLVLLVSYQPARSNASRAAPICAARDFLRRVARVFAWSVSRSPLVCHYCSSFADGSCVDCEESEIRGCEETTKSRATEVCRSDTDRPLRYHRGASPCGSYGSLVTHNLLRSSPATRFRARRGPRTTAALVATMQGQRRPRNARRADARTAQRSWGHGLRARSRFATIRPAIIARGTRAERAEPGAGGRAAGPLSLGPSSASGTVRVRTAWTIYDVPDDVVSRVVRVVHRGRVRSGIHHPSCSSLSTDRTMIRCR